MTDLIVNLSVKETLKKMTEKIDSSMSGTVLDYHPLPGDGAVIIYEKYYYRAENMLTLTAVVYPEGANTHVHLVSGGGGSGLFGIDWGASGSFETSVEEALDRYIISRSSNDGAVL